MLSEVLPVHPLTGLTAIGILPSGRPVWPVLGGAPGRRPARQDDDGDGDGDDDSADDGQDDDEGQDDDAGAAGGDDGDGQEPDGNGTGQDDDQPEGYDQLGDKGKQALDRMKAERKNSERARRSEERRRRRAEKRAADAEAELAKLRNGARKNDQDGDGQPDAEELRREAEKAATERANDRIKKAEVKAAAAGKLADPADALRFIDLSQLEVGDDGEIDSDEVADMIEDLVKRKPYLAAATASRWQGTADGGARKGPRKPSQLTRTELSRMTPAEITKAKAEGRMDALLGRKS